MTLPGHGQRLQHVSDCLTPHSAMTVSSTRGMVLPRRRPVEQEHGDPSPRYGVRRGTSRGSTTRPATPQPAAAGSRGLLLGVRGHARTGVVRRSSGPCPSRGGTAQVPCGSFRRTGQDHSTMSRPPGHCSRTWPAQRCCSRAPGIIGRRRTLFLTVLHETSRNRNRRDRQSSQDSSHGSSRRIHHVNRLRGGSSRRSRCR